MVELIFCNIQRKNVYSGMYLYQVVFNILID